MASNWKLFARLVISLHSSCVDEYSLSRLRVSLATLSGSETKSRTFTPWPSGYPLMGDCVLCQQVLEWKGTLDPERPGAE